MLFYSHNRTVPLCSTGAVAKLKLGTRNMDYNGCEVIAVYNTMLTLGDRKDIRDIAYHFENDGQALWGVFGTNPYAAKRYFTQNGYKVKTIEGENIRDEKIPDADAYVLSYWNKRDIMDGLHTVSVRKINGEYELFNYGKEDDDPPKVDDLWKELMKKRHVPLLIHCISKE